MVTLRMLLPREAPAIASVCGLFPSSSFFERELAEMFGITVVNTPTPTTCFCRRTGPRTCTRCGRISYRTRHSFIDSREYCHGNRITREVHHPDRAAHPALKEPGHFEFNVDGEIVTNATVRLGYVHRGIEKATEDRNWVQNLYLLERICGICSHSHAMAYALGVEKLAGVTAPPRAQAIREVTAEMERIHSHLLWLGVAAHQAGFDTLFMFSWRDRETIMDILEGLTGNRVNYSVNVLGGVKVDIDDERAGAIRRGSDFWRSARSTT